MIFNSDLIYYTVYINIQNSENNKFALWKEKHICFNTMYIIDWKNNRMTDVFKKKKYCAHIMLSIIYTIAIIIIIFVYLKLNKN